MSLSKRVRFAIFNRDGFRCAYCGRTPPEVILEVDHVVPKSKDGPDDESNLITACLDCNRGKSDNNLITSDPSALKDRAKNIMERESQIGAYNRALKKQRERIEKDIDEIERIYLKRYDGFFFSQKFRERKMVVFLSKIPREKMLDAMRRATANFEKRPNDSFNRSSCLDYFCAICWRMIKGEVVV